jgi:hypothetical protein
MNVGIDARLLHSTTGIGRYTRSLFTEYTQREYLQHDHLTLFADALSFQNPGLPDNVTVVISRVSRAESSGRTGVFLLYYTTRRLMCIMGM